MVLVVHFVSCSLFVYLYDILIVFNRINQPDAANSQVYYLSFKYSSTCFGHPHAHHQELQQILMMVT